MNPPLTSSRRDRILRPGRNTWRIETADAAAFLVDGEAYFRQLDRALRMARRSIRIVGWDFNPDISLRPQQGGERLGALLRALVDKEPRLEVHILVWAMGPVYSSHSLKLFTEHTWSDHPRIHLRFDKRHALRGSHHQKMVTVDDSLAFVGGIDLTGKRWDTNAHEAHSAHRLDLNDHPYGPVHDVQAMISGPTAGAIADLIRWRWSKATGDSLPSLDRRTAIWPEDAPMHLQRCSVAIGRAVPALFGFKGRRETIRLTLDAVALARRHIYIETQYLASFRVGNALARRLREPDGPEIVILVTSSSRGMLEQLVMAHNRDRLIRRLRKADRFARLRVMYAVVPDENGNDLEVLIHSKVLVADDTFVRVGSSNLNNRSEGLDTECDVAIEASNKAECRAIAAFRDRLVAEHLDTSAKEVAKAIRGSSLVGAIDHLNSRPRGLRSFPGGLEDGSTSALPGTALLDPARPFLPIRKLRHWLSRCYGWAAALRSSLARRRSANSRPRNSGRPKARGTKK